jgi:hypothetical protein
MKFFLEKLQQKVNNVKKELYLINFPIVEENKCNFH